VQAYIKEPEVWLFFKSQRRWISRARLISVNESEIVFRYETNEKEYGERCWEAICALSDLIAIEKKIDPTQTLRERLAEVS
jgi:hypothetical protein